jgi:hypothetical protein
MGDVERLQAVLQHAIDHPDLAGQLSKDIRLSGFDEYALTLLEYIAPKLNQKDFRQEAIQVEG